MKKSLFMNLPVGANFTAKGESYSKSSETTATAISGVFKGDTIHFGSTVAVNWHKKDADEYCPHCGYYCTGKTAFCTKR